MTPVILEPPVATPTAKEDTPQPAPSLPGNAPPTWRERRQFHRIMERIPVAIKFSDLSEAVGETANFCVRGIYFHVEKRLAPGAQMDLVFKLPKQIVSRPNVWMRCKAQVLRVDENLSDGKTGIAATLMEYEILET
jgi:PilZ domain